MADKISCFVVCGTDQPYEDYGEPEMVFTDRQRAEIYVAKSPKYWRRKIFETPILNTEQSDG